jgi:hypothetical protein
MVALIGLSEKVTLGSFVQSSSFPSPTLSFSHLANEKKGESTVLDGDSSDTLSAVLRTSMIRS